MKNNIAIVSLFLTISTIAQAYPTHTFSCKVGPEESQKSMYLEIEDSDVESGMGKITLSNWVIPENVGQRIDLDDCGIVDGPCYTYVSPSWVPFQQAQNVMMELEWTFNSVTSEKIITGAKVNMGKSGSIVVATSGKADEFNSMTGDLKATAMGFNYPNGVVADCYYFHILGPKPGLTGSN